MILYIAILLGIIAVELFGILVRLGHLMRYTQDSRSILRSVSKQVHTRQAVASVQSGPVTQEQHLARLGRHSAGRRVVFGGDEDSELHQDLTNRSKTP